MLIYLQRSPPVSTPGLDYSSDDSDISTVSGIGGESDAGGKHKIIKTTKTVSQLR